jgi:hypothetical protein
MKKQMSKAAVLAILPLALLLRMSAPAFALEVPKDGTEARVPVAAELRGPAAGVEIGFTHTGEGFSFARFEPSADLSGALRVNAERDGVIWVGVFSDENTYGEASGGRLALGDLVFTYAGDAENTVTLTACTVYTVDAAGEPVSEARAAGGTVTITRAADTPAAPGRSPGGGLMPANTGLVVGIDEDETPIAETAEADVTFSDLTQAEWAREAVEYMVKNKGILGMGDGLFAPNAEVTRAQFARFAAQAFDIERGETEASFTDAAESAWYFADVTTLASAGILTGYGDGRFGPEDRISREQMAVIIDRTLALKDIALPESRAFDLTDGDAASVYARASIERLYGAGVINGMGNGTFAPKATATRAQSCVILYNALRAADLL